MTNTPFRPTIQSQSDLQRTWEHLMGPWSFGGQSIWMMLIVGDHPHPHLTEISEADEPPDDEMAGRLVALLQMLDGETDPGMRVAFLRSRPGFDVVTDDDRAWATALYDVARRAAVPCEVVHLGTRGSIRSLPPDELEVAAAAG